MIHFVDLTHLENGHPTCAFFNTVSDCFLSNTFGTQDFDSPEDLEEIVPEGYRERAKAMVPEGFWEPRPTSEWQCFWCAHVNEKDATVCDDCKNERRTE